MARTKNDGGAVTLDGERFRSLLMDQSLLRELFETFGSDDYGELLSTVRRARTRRGRDKKPKKATSPEKAPQTNGEATGPTAVP